MIVEGGGGAGGGGGLNRRGWVWRGLSTWLLHRRASCQLGQNSTGHSRGSFLRFRHYDIPFRGANWSDPTGSKAYSVCLDRSCFGPLKLGRRQPNLRQWQSTITPIHLDLSLIVLKKKWRKKAQREKEKVPHPTGYWWWNFQQNIKMRRREFITSS